MSAPSRQRSGAAGRTAVQALVTLGALFVMQRFMITLRTTVARSFWLQLVHALDEWLMRALNAAPGIAHLEEPSVQNRIEIARGAGISGQGWQGWNAGRATLALCNKAPLWLQSAGYAVLLAGFQPALAAAYFALITAISEVRRRQYLRETRVMWTQSSALRRANYLRDLGLTSGAAKEVRIYRDLRKAPALTPEIEGGMFQRLHAAKKSCRLLQDSLYCSYEHFHQDTQIVLPAS